MSVNRYNKAKFLLSAHTLAQLPQDHGLEVAFAGRSNVGKSCVINAITNNRRLARISKTPGRTQQLNFFELDSHKRLVDLPGYGYAKVSAKIQQHWRTTLNRYFECRHSLTGLILIMDIRHPLKSHDVQMLEWCQAAGLPVHILLNKEDKLSRGASRDMLYEVRKHIAYEKTSTQLFSALKSKGVEEARGVLDKWFENQHGV
ncbi:MAG: ribosome biogenesis GTP-binding protein YihA/YsxC [Gammaproteobacteria bacterium]